MTGVLANIGLALLFIVIGGVFAAAEMALVSLREGQANALARRGRRGQRVARLYRDPNLFLSAVQVGVTLSGFLASAFAGATLAGDLSPLLQDAGLPEGVADTVALVLITVVVAYTSIVLGELAAKRLALQNAESFSYVLGPFIDRMARISRPLIWSLSVSTNLVVRVLGGDPHADRERMSEEELRQLVSGHETLGEEERAIVDDVFEAGGRQLREVMVPRTDVDFLDANEPVYKTVKFVVERPHSRYPVARGSADDVVGFVHVRDLLNPEISNRSVRVGELVREVLYLPSTKRVLGALSELRAAGQHLAIVLDEYGGTAGIVTLEDLVEELVGEITDEYDIDRGALSRRLVSGDIDVDGRMNLGDFAEETGVAIPDGPYETVAGFVIAQLGHLPEAGESVRWENHRFTVTELDGHRVARIRFTRHASDVVPPLGEDAVDEGESAPRRGAGRSERDAGRLGDTGDAAAKAGRKSDGPEPDGAAKGAGEKGTGEKGTGEGTGAEGTAKDAAEKGGAQGAKAAGAAGLEARLRP